MLVGMSNEREYEPSTWQWVRDQVDEYERTNGASAAALADTNLAIIVMTMIGRKTGKIRKAPVMKVEHHGEYAIVASKGGDPKHPDWYFNLLAHPDEVQIQDRADRFSVRVHEAKGEERSVWWQRAVDAFPNYAEYQAKTDRIIPLLVATPIP